ncbi:ATP/GTP-binding protein [Lactococcus garvieae]|uniref:AAA family ATPase n=1 Tax=Lactococcus garvieae TaxID=1363 RepID=UPI003854E1E3
MFTYLKFENYLSFKDETVISFENKVPSKQPKIFVENSIKKEGNKQFLYFSSEKKSKIILNSSIIYGANASGKSNLLSPLTLVKSILLSKDKERGEDLTELPFNFVKQINPITKIEVGFIDKLEDKKFYYFTYTLHMDCEKKLISYEKLTYAPMITDKFNKSEVVFERNYEDLVSGQKDIRRILDKVIMDDISLVPLLKLLNTNINTKLFTEEVETSHFKMIELTFYTLTDGIVFASDNRQSRDFAEKLLNDKEYKAELLSKLEDFDFSIQDITVENMTKTLIDTLEKTVSHEKFSESGISEENVEKLIKKIKEDKPYKIETVHKIEDTEFSLRIGLESEGTNKFIHDFVNIYDAVSNGKLYIADEFEESYHDVIQKSIVSYLFEGSDENKSQFILTTHNTNFLSSDFFAKEQINFVSKDRKTQASVVRRLSDFKEITYDKHNWEKLYLEGKLGAIPEVY